MSPSYFFLNSTWCQIVTIQIGSWKVWDCVLNLTTRFMNLC